MLFHEFDSSGKLFSKDIRVPLWRIVRYLFEFPATAGSSSREFFLLYLIGFFVEVVN